MKKSQLDIERITKSILNKASVPEPGASFTENVMNKLNIQKSSLIYTYKPLLSKKFLYITGFAFTLMIFLVLMATPKSSDTGSSTLLSEHILPVVNTFFAGISDKAGFDFMNPLLIFGIIAIWFFWAIDHFAKKLLRK